ncbi:MAG: hypothetical protein JKX90_04835 [Colwellia sp.]|nr:hypothetical protein [Colwellia sp.]
MHIILDTPMALACIYPLILSLGYLLSHSSVYAHILVSELLEKDSEKIRVLCSLGSTEHKIPTQRKRIRKSAVGA